MPEKVRVTKQTLRLVDDTYAHPNTSTLIFRFEPKDSSTTLVRLQKASIKHALIGAKDLYLIDDFFLPHEAKDLHDFSTKTTFSRHSYGSPEAIAKGEKPALSMNGKERWQFFSSPPAAVSELYQLFGMLSEKLFVDITTLPWELCDAASHGSPAVIANRLERASIESRELGKHQDCDPQKRISFAIPVLYSNEKDVHPNRFENGSFGKPWLVSLMLYTSDPNYNPAYRMGTVFYSTNDQIALRVNCSNMRLVLFEGDILHSIEESQIPTGMNTWRISYVFKLIINPKEATTSAKKTFFDLLNRTSCIECLPVGPDMRV